MVVDIRFFLFLLLLTVWGFACAFYILFRRDQSKHVRPQASRAHSCSAPCRDIASGLAAKLRA